MSLLDLLATVSDELLTGLARVLVGDPILLYHADLTKTPWTQADLWGAGDLQGGDSHVPGSNPSGMPGPAGLTMSISRPAGTPVGQVVSVGAFATPITLARDSAYLLVAEYEALSGPANPGATWAAGLSVRPGDAFDDPALPRLTATLQVRVTPQGVRGVRLNAPGTSARNTRPNAAAATTAAVLDQGARFALYLLVDQASGSGEAMLTVAGGLVDRVAFTIDSAVQQAELAAAGAGVAVLAGDATPAVVRLLDLKVYWDRGSMERRHHDLLESARRALTRWSFPLPRPADGWSEDLR